MTGDEATDRLIERFTGALRAALPVSAVWAHGSLAGGDYQPGRSDLDLIAVLDRPCTAEQGRRLDGLHERLAEDVPLASKLHCGYLAAGESADPARPHLAWAHQEFTHRPVTPVTRRELHAFGLTLHGRPPADLLPPVTGEQLADFVAEDLADYWRPHLDRPELWLRDVWVDLGLLTLARAHETLRTGRLITKAEALGVLAGLGAPPEVVADIGRRRYGGPGPVPDRWPARRAELTRAFLGPAIDRVLAEHRPGPAGRVARRASAPRP